jgi:hypothetical protein
MDETRQAEFTDNRLHNRPSSSSASAMMCAASIRLTSGRSGSAGQLTEGDPRCEPASIPIDDESRNALLVPAWANAQKANQR